MRPDPKTCSLCGGPATVSAIGTYAVFGLEESTVALALCERHAGLLQDEVLTLRVDAG